MRDTLASSTYILHETSIGTPSAHATAAFTGLTCVTTTTVDLDASSARSEQAADTRPASISKDSPPGGAYDASVRHVANVASGIDPGARPSNSP